MDDTAASKRYSGILNVRPKRKIKALHHYEKISRTPLR